MTDVNIFLRVIQKEGYPNPNLHSIARMVDYNLENFLVDLKEEIGEDGVKDFCDKAIEKISAEDGIKIELDPDEFVYLHVYPLFYDEDESENDVVSNYEWGKSRLLSSDEDGKEYYTTIEQIIDDTDMGGWSELDELLDHIKMKAYNHINQLCGFGVWWE